MRSTIASPNAHFLAGELPAGGEIRSRWLTGTAFSIAIHVLGLGVVLFTATHVSQVVRITDAAATRALVFLPQKGPQRGGGGRDGPNERPRPAEIVAAKAINVITPVPKPADVPLPDILVTLQTPFAAHTLPGTLTPLDVAGTGTTGGGAGTGMDGGRGSGVGPGRGGNPGGGARQIGNGVTSPVLFHEVRPTYTAEAMRARVQGAVEMEAVVRADGSVDPQSLKITRSLDPTFGLDEQAMLAVRQWRFRPGTLHGRAVAVIVQIELTFALR